ncbi:MAG: hypothetical protein RLZZ385_2214 [Pseudomonadota bacterium]|jgi:hypothetical protein
MPPLDTAGRSTSFFEFWPTWLMYLPVVIQWLGLAVWYRSLSLPLIANPAIPLSGMVGVPKSAVFDLAGPDAARWILPWLLHTVDRRPVSVQCTDVVRALEQKGLTLPVVAKPNLGCRGAGVRRIADAAALRAYLQGFPVGGVVQLQQLAPWEAEAGVFYVRFPGEREGTITSLTLKYSPYVVGDGSATLGELVARDPRAGQLQRLYRERHSARWGDVIPAGTPYRLVFSASHCRGAIFRDGRQFITPALRARLDHLFDHIPGFHYGRLDIKFRDLDRLMAGEDFAVIEINGASAESIHIWDRDTRLGAALATLLEQYRTLYAVGHANRQLGHRPPGLTALWRAWRLESALLPHYPAND